MNLYRNHFRRTTFISDKRENLLLRLSNISSSSRVLFVSNDSKHFTIQQNIISISTKEVNRFLGQEFDCILYDASDAFNANAFTAIVGTLVGGGELILNLPSDFEKIKGNNQAENRPINPLLYRFIQLSHSSHPADLSTQESNSEYLVEQQRLIEKINRCALGHAKRPLVITANRGRGKSACLGMAAANLALQHNKQIIITAPRKANVEIFFQHVVQHSNLIHIRKNSQTEPSESRNIENSDNISYFAPDRLIKEKPDACLLIIDEAGAIPVQILQQMVSLYNRVVLSTTIDGYEGNGRGFDIRFKSTLTESFPQWRSATLQHPMRWPINDPLEMATNAAFLLNNSIETAVGTCQPADTNFQQVTKSRLFNDENLLKQIYALLVDAHYQTRPSDLDRILSDNALLVFVAFSNEQVVATALVCIEGNLPAQQCEKIECNEMRLPGHLLPQSLMAYQGIQNAGEFKFWRIMRIAVRSEFQRKKIASQLINHIEQQASNADVDFIGASFSLNLDVVRFWYQLGFRCCRLALRKDSSTGTYPGEFLKSIDTAKAKAKTNFYSATSRFEDSFYYSMSASYSDIQPEILLCIIKHQCHGETKKLSKETKADIGRYIEKARSFEMVEWQLSQLLKLYFAGVLREQKLSLSAEHLLVAKLLQKKPWKTFVAEFEFNGKKPAQESVLNAVSELALILTPK